MRACVCACARVCGEAGGERISIVQPIRSIYNKFKRSRNATLFQLKIDGVLFKVIDGDNEPFQSKIDGVLFKVIDADNEPSSFQEILMNSTKRCLK